MDNAPTRTPPPDLAGLLGAVERLQGMLAAWDAPTRSTAEAYGNALETLHGEALRRLVRALKTEPAAVAAMKAALGDELVYAVFRRHGIVKPSLSERVETALASVRPLLASHGGDVELVRLAPPVAEVRFLGACDGCPASLLTFHAGVRKAVQDACPEITEIAQATGSASEDSGVRFVSPFALEAVGDWLAAGTLAEIPEGGVRALALDDQNVILSRQGAVVSCFANACAHLGFAIDDGEIDAGIITCPHHGFRYDLASGECLTAPEVQLHAHAVRVVGDRVEVRLAR